MESYDPAKNEWKMVASMMSPRSNAGVVAVGNYIFAAGGFDGNEFLNTIEVYNAGLDEWSPYTRMCRS